MKNKNLIIFISAGVVVAGLVIWAFSGSSNKSASPSPSPSETPKENPPPENPNLQTIQVKLDETKTALGTTITPKNVIEDSRCPTNVECIQAGTVKVSADISDESGQSTQIFELDKPFTTKFVEIRLVRVEPLRSAGATIPPESYLFYFQIRKL